MNLSVAYRGGTKFHILSGAHVVVSDQPAEDGGTNAGMSPVELFVGSMVSCIAFFVARYCERHHIPCEGFVVDAEYDMVERPHRVGPMTVRIQLPATVNPSEQERLLRVAEGCTVHQTVLKPSAVHIRLSTAGATWASSA
ncbi:hypothetical protein YTPLAS18_36730 [Nitrospira sp.]|nr:hypothetical protein YTPLAS18_36730 [Nitrospira sp.]